MSEQSKEERDLVEKEKIITLALCHTVTIWIDENAPKPDDELNSKVEELKKNVPASLPAVLQPIWWDRVTGNEGAWMKPNWFLPVNQALGVYDEQLATILKEFDHKCKDKIEIRPKVRKWMEDNPAARTGHQAIVPPMGETEGAVFYYRGSIGRYVAQAKLEEEKQAKHQAEEESREQ